MELGRTLGLGNGGNKNQRRMSLGLNEKEEKRKIREDEPTTHKKKMERSHLEEKRSNF